MPLLGLSRCTPSSKKRFCGSLLTQRLVQLRHLGVVPARCLGLVAGRRREGNLESGWESLPACVPTIRHPGRPEPRLRRAAHSLDVVGHFVGGDGSLPGHLDRGCKERSRGQADTRRSSQTCSTPCSLSGGQKPLVSLSSFPSPRAAYQLQQLEMLPLPSDGRTRAAETPGPTNPVPGGLPFPAVSCLTHPVPEAGTAPGSPGCCCKRHGSAPSGEAQKSHTVGQHKASFGRCLLPWSLCLMHHHGHFPSFREGRRPAGSAAGRTCHVQERKCWEPGPKSRWASWSCFRRSFMEACRTGQQSAMTAFPSSILDHSPHQEGLWMDSEVPQPPRSASSLACLGFALPRQLSPHLLPWAEAAQATSPARLYPYFQTSAQPQLVLTTTTTPSRPQFSSDSFLCSSHRFFLLYRFTSHLPHT